MHNNKQINIQPLNCYKLLVKVLKLLKRSCLLIVVFILFMLGYYSTHTIFSNQYILNIFITNNGYSRKCLTLVEQDQSLVYQINSFYEKVDHNHIIPPVFFLNLPSSLGEVSDSKVRKNVFINILIPMLLKNQINTIEERKNLLAISNKLLWTPLAEEDFQYIKTLANKYKVRMDGDAFWHYSSALEELLIRVDIIPMSLAIAIVAKETDWGVSGGLVETNSLFSKYGLNTYFNMQLTEKDPVDYHFVRKLSSLEDAIEAFYINVNTNNSYRGFRQYRLNARLDNKSMDPYGLANRLTNFSGDRNYTRDLQRIISDNNLVRFDRTLIFNTSYNSTCLKIVR